MQPMEFMGRVEQAAFPAGRAQLNLKVNLVQLVLFYSQRAKRTSIFFDWKFLRNSLKLTFSYAVRICSNRTRAGKSKPTHFLVKLFE